MSVEDDGLEQIPELFGYLLGRIPSKRCVDEAFCFVQLAAIEGERRGAAMNDRPRWLCGINAAEQCGSVALKFEGVPCEIGSARLVPTHRSQIGGFRLLHRLIVVFANSSHFCTTLEVGEPNS